MQRNSEEEEEENRKDLRNRGADSGFWCRVLAQAATPEPRLGVSVHHPVVDLSSTLPFLEQEGFAFHQLRSQRP